MNNSTLKLKFLFSILILCLHTATLATTPLLISTSPGGLFHKFSLDLAPELSKILNSTVVIEPRPGGNGLVAAQALAANKSDRLSLLLTYPIGNLEIDQTSDIIPVAYLGSATSILVARPNPNYKNAQQLLEYSKNNNISFGAVNANNLVGYMDIMFSTHGNKNQVAKVLYRNGGQLLTEVVGGHVDVALSTPSVAMPYITEGKLIVLGAIGSARSRLLPDVSTLSQQGFSIPNETKFFNYIILWANPGADKLQIVNLRKQINQYLLTPEGDEVLRRNGLSLDRRRQHDPAATVAEVTKN